MKTRSQGPPDNYAPPSTTKRTPRRSGMDFQSLINGTHSVYPSGSSPFTANAVLSPATEELSTTASPAGQQGRVLLPGNLLWALMFGWWLAHVSFVSAGRPRWWT